MKKSNAKVVVVGGGAGGLASVASLQKRAASLDITIIEPSDKHYYQPGWTLVGAGVFQPGKTVRSMDAIWPKDANRIKDRVTIFEPDNNLVVLGSGQSVSYDILIVAPGLTLGWDQIEGLEDALGRNGVTSNYRFDLAPYTWKLVQEMAGKEAIFTQPAMPIKCAGAPQKAMYLSCDSWLKRGALSGIHVTFASAIDVLFGCKPYVSPLMEYIDYYGIDLQFKMELIKVDADKKLATFKTQSEDQAPVLIERDFDMLHVCPPQRAPDFVKNSPLANKGGWLDVDPHSLRHKTYENIFGVGDICGTANAKTAAAVRKQAPVVAQNILLTLEGKSLLNGYDGYGSCPLTVEKGKIILAEFGYEGKLMPTFPWDSTKARKSAWVLKKHLLPIVYWEMMLKGREWP
ncbi:MAG: NAD(P)/FAD-dependent oxidoreductase [Rhodobacteraceae bacterium]|nr:NAD(P)/FAD-dependent oxidoreductase [Paracoccaceae bacterium]